MVPKESCLPVSTLQLINEKPTLGRSQDHSPRHMRKTSLDFLSQLTIATWMRPDKIIRKTTQSAVRIMRYKVIFKTTILRIICNVAMHRWWKMLGFNSKSNGGPQRQKKYRMIRFYGRSGGKNYQLQNKFWSRELYFKPREYRVHKIDHS